MMAILLYLEASPDINDSVHFQMNVTANLLRHLNLPRQRRRRSRSQVEPIVSEILNMPALRVLAIISAKYHQCSTPLHLLIL
jgi:hypothetical protein